MYDQVKLLYENQLWSNLCRFGSLVLGMSKLDGGRGGGSNEEAAAATGDIVMGSSPEASSSSSAPGPSCSTSASSSSAGCAPLSAMSMSPLVLNLSPKERLYLLCMVGEAYFINQNFVSAEMLFKEALQVGLCSAVIDSHRF